jgi:glycosyltransferase involved in cell wall biosynthesis
LQLTVVIPCRNGSSYLRRQLVALSSQDGVEDWEVVVVDNRSTDGSRAVASEFGGRLNLRVVDADERVSPSYARNVGARAASGDKLLFVDADDEVAPGYLAAMATALEQSDFVTARVDIETLNPAWNRAALGPPWQEQGVEPFFDYLPAASVCIGLARPLYLSVGGFPEEFPRLEDIAFCWKIQLRGTPLRFVPGAVYRYRYRDTLPGLYRQSRDWAVSAPLLYREFRAAGMPRRPLGRALALWAELPRWLVRARSKADLARLVVELGSCMGRLKGSVRYRVVYL